VLQNATNQARDILDAATTEANELRLGAMAYVDEILGNVQNAISYQMQDITIKYDNYIKSLNSSLEVVIANRKELNPSDEINEDLLPDAVPTEEEDNITIDDTEIYANYGGGIEAAGGTIVVNDGVTVEQKGMYTAPYNSMAISVNGGGKVTVNGGTFSTECITAEEANNQGTSHGPWVAGVLNSGGTLIINGGTFDIDAQGDGIQAETLLETITVK
jgi:hypothetical protein